MNMLTRRHAFALALAAQAAQLPVEIAAQPVPPAWRDLIRQCGALHPDGATAAIRAYLAGLAVASFSGFTLARRRDGKDSPHLTFGPWWDYETPYQIVTPT